MTNITKIKEDLSGLTIMQTAELIKMLQEDWGVSAAAPVAVAAAVPVAAEAAAEKTDFDVILVSSGDKKIEVIKVVRELIGLGLIEAKNLVSEAPKPIKHGVNKEEATKMKESLEAVGAKVELK